MLALALIFTIARHVDVSIGLLKGSMFKVLRGRVASAGNNCSVLVDERIKNDFLWDLDEIGTGV